jgi:hypothetical protein
MLAFIDILKNGPGDIEKIMFIKIEEYEIIKVLII